MTATSRRTLLAGLMFAPLLCGRARAAEYPERPVRVVVPYAAGGASDIIARMVTAHMARTLGQQLYVDNRGGGASLIGTQAVATAAADGYTIGVVDTAFVINPGLLGAKVPYDTVKDFAPVSLIARTPLVLVVPMSLPVSSVADLIALAKAKPGRLNMASAGLGTAIHLCGEQFRQEAGIDVVHVPYRGGGPSFIDLITGKVDFTFATVPAVVEYVRGGKMRAVGVTATSVSQLPDVPSMAEAGLPKVDAFAEFGMVAPARTPANIVAALNAAVVAAVKDDKLRQQLLELGYEPAGSAPAEYAARIASEINKWAKVIRDGNIKPE